MILVLIDRHRDRKDQNFGSALPASARQKAAVEDRHFKWISGKCRTKNER